MMERGLRLEVPFIRRVISAKGDRLCLGEIICDERFAYSKIFSGGGSVVPSVRSIVRRTISCILSGPKYQLDLFGPVYGYAILPS